MHFKTLVTVNMPTVEEDPHEKCCGRTIHRIAAGQKR